MEREFLRTVTASMVERPIQVSAAVRWSAFREVELLERRTFEEGANTDSDRLFWWKMYLQRLPEGILLSKHWSELPPDHGESFQYDARESRLRHSILLHLNEHLRIVALTREGMEVALKQANSARTISRLQKPLQSVLSDQAMRDAFYALFRCGADAAFREQSVRPSYTGRPSSNNVQRGIDNARDEAMRRVIRGTKQEWILFERSLDGDLSTSGSPRV